MGASGLIPVAVPIVRSARDFSRRCVQGGWTRHAKRGAGNGRTHCSWIALAAGGTLLAGAGGARLPGQAIAVRVALFDDRKLNNRRGIGGILAIALALQGTTHDSRQALGRDGWGIGNPLLWG